MCACVCVCVCAMCVRRYIPVTLVGVALQSGEVLHGDGKEHNTFIHSQHYSRENTIVHCIIFTDRISCAYIYIYIYIYTTT